MSATRRLLPLIAVLLIAPALAPEVQAAKPRENAQSPRAASRSPAKPLAATSTTPATPAGKARPDTNATPAPSYPQEASLSALSAVANVPAEPDQRPVGRLSASYSVLIVFPNDSIDWSAGGSPGAGVVNTTASRVRVMLPFASYVNSELPALGSVDVTVRPNKSATTTVWLPASSVIVVVSHPERVRVLVELFAVWL